MESPEPVIVIRNHGGVIIGWNESAALTFGYTAGEAIGRSIDLIIPDDGTSQSPLSELSCRTKHGGTLRMLSRRSFVTDGTDHVLAVSEILTPLDASAKAPLRAPHPLEDTQGTKRPRLPEVDDASGVVITYRTYPDDRQHLTFASAGAEALYGFTEAQLEADPSLVSLRIPFDDLARCRAARIAAEHTLRPWCTQLRYLHPRGDTKWLDARALPTREADGSVVWRGVVLDVTANKLAEEKRKAVQSQLESVLDAAELGTWIWDVEANLCWGNAVFRALWEIPDDAPPWFDLLTSGGAHIHAEDQAVIDSTIQRLLQGESRSELEFRLVHSNGSICWISARARSNESTPRGAVRRLTGVNTDITAQKVADEAALRSSKLEALGTLAGGIAHDFNNLLFAITGNAALTLGALPPEHTTRGFVNAIAGAAQRATELVRQILVFSRPEEQERKPLQLASAVQDALTLVRASTPAMIEIASSCDPSTPTVIADSSRIVQIVINLCTNAVHAIGKARPGHIRVHVAPLRVQTNDAAAADGLAPGLYATLSVSDDGCGMDIGTQARIFDPFFTTRAPGEGAGLGLSVVHGLVNALGGKVTVNSELGRGTTLRLHFPAAPDDASAREPTQQPPETEGRRILFVDDESMLVALGESMLEVLGYRAAAFEEPKAALAAFRADPQSFDAAVTDLSMPAMSGFDLTRALLAIRSDLPIMVMSGYIGPEERATAAQLGVRELVLKPVSIERMGELLARLC